MIFATLRLLGLARRGVRALESLADSQRELALVARNQRLQEESRRARVPRKTEIGTMDLTAAEKRYRLQHPELGEFPEDSDAREPA
jgi:short-subunit dehydrogenase